MPTLTPNYSFNLPLVNDPIDADLWGGELNANFSSLDTLLKTISDVANAASAGTLVGELKAYSGSTAPAKWILAYGQAIDRTTYASLFAICGTTYGSGDGSTTFNVPDFRGRVPAGQDDMGGTSANRLTVAGCGFDGDTLGATGGSEFMQLHTHTASQAAHNHTLGNYANTFAGAGGAVDVTARTGYSATGTAQTTGNATPAITVDNAGTGTSQNVQPTIVVNWLIYTGV